MSDVIFKSNKTAVMSEMDRMKNLALEAIGMEFTHNAVNNITQRGHVDTGRMRASQTHQVNLQDSEVIVGNTAEYAVHVELPGITRNWAGGNFMRDAMNNHQGDYERIAKTIMEGFG